MIVNLLLIENFWRRKMPVVICGYLGNGKGFPKGEFLQTNPSKAQA
jgi:hypothetical protein